VLHFVLPVFSKLTVALGFEVMNSDFNVRIAFPECEKRQAFDAYERGIDTRLNTRILELEKRYNFAQSENKALKAQVRVKIFIAVSLLLLLLLGAVIFDWNRRRKIALLEKTNTQSKLQLVR